MIPDFVSLNDVLKTTSRISFTDSEWQALITFLEGCEKKGRDLRLGSLDDPVPLSEGGEFAKEGLFILASRMLGQEFVLAKCDGGRTIFGRQKIVYSSFVGSIRQHELMAGPIFKSWLLAMTSIGNIYRAYGLR